MTETRYQRVAREQAERQEARESREQDRVRKVRAANRRRHVHGPIALSRIADRIDGYDRDDLGESLDF